MRDCIQICQKAAHMSTDQNAAGQHLWYTIPDVARVSNQSFCIFCFAARCNFKPSVPCSTLTLHKSIPCLGDLHAMLPSGNAHTGNAHLGGIDDIKTYLKI